MTFLNHVVDKEALERRQWAIERALSSLVGVEADTDTIIARACTFLTFVEQGPSQPPRQLGEAA